MHIAVILNPIAGACRQHSALQTMLARLRSMGTDIDMLPTACAGDATTLAHKAAGWADYVIAAGGDGTVREVLGGLADTGVPLMIWPAGTENLAAKSLGFRPEIDLIPACITAGRTTAIDLGTANGHYFAVVAGMGFDAEVVDRLVAIRAGHITHLSYLEPIWRTFWNHKFPRLRFIHNEAVYWEGRCLAFVGNIWRYSLGLPVVRDAIPDDGLLDLLILPCSNQLQLLAHSARTVLARHIEHAGAKYMQFTHLRVESLDGVPYELDGDSGGTLPVDFQVHRHALTLRLPQT